MKLLSRTEIILLLDYYGNLLSDKQLEAMEDYYFNDFSLSEIAGNTGVSKQAVSDLIKRAVARLVEIENELGLVNRSRENKGIIDEILASLDLNWPNINLENLKNELSKLRKNI